MSEKQVPGWVCSDCGGQHGDLATWFGPSAPEAWYSASPEQRATGDLTDDTCSLTLEDATHHFVRAEIELPLVDGPLAEEPFVWSVWCSLSASNMALVAEHEDDPERVDLPPMFGWLGTLLPYAPSTLHLPTNVHLREPGAAPWVQCDPDSDHLLAREQRDGITWHRAAELNALVLAPPEPR